METQSCDLLIKIINHFMHAYNSITSLFRITTKSIQFNLYDRYINSMKTFLPLDKKFKFSLFDLIVLPISKYIIKNDGFSV